MYVLLLSFDYLIQNCWMVWLYLFYSSVVPQKNPNCMLMVTPKGGHLGWVAGAEAPLGAPWTDPIVMDFLQHLEQARLPNTASSASLKDSNSIGNTQSLHQLEVWTHTHTTPWFRHRMMIGLKICKPHHINYI